MAFNKIQINHTDWTLIAGNVDVLTFQNSGQQQIYINVTSDSTAPTDDIGLIYDTFQGELLADPTRMTMAAGKYVWAKTTTGFGYVIVET